MNQWMFSHTLRFTLMAIVGLSLSWSEVAFAGEDSFDMQTSAEVPEEADVVPGNSVALAIVRTKVDATDRDGISRRCGFIPNQTLSPEFEALIESSCPRQNARTESYCTCVGRFMRSSRGAGLHRRVEARELEMQRVGYQLLLEEWADNYGANILSFAALKQRTLGSQVASSLPDTCKPDVIFNRLRMAMAEPNCANPNPAFREAVQAVLRVPQNRDVFDPLQTDNAEITELLARSEEMDRLYFPPGGRSRYKNFRDCMEPAEKRAYALLPIDFGTGRNFVDSAARTTKRRDRISKMNEEIDKVIANGGVVDKSNEEKLTAVLDIFPGLQALLQPTSGISRQDTLAIFNQLKVFVTDLNNPVYRDLRDVRNSANVMSRMKASVDAMNTLVSAKMVAANANGQRIAEQVRNACSVQSEELRLLACSQESHVRDPVFMAYAYEDINRRGTRPRELNVRRFAQCQMSDVDDGPEGVSDCLVYHQAQCNSINNFITAKARNTAAGVAETSDSPGLSIDGVANRIEMNKDLRADEEQMVQLVCADFNQYLRTNACSQFAPVSGAQGGSNDHRAADSRNDEYRRCIMSQTVEHYRAATGGDARLNALVANGWSPPSVGSTIRGNLLSEINNTDILPADVTPVVNTVGSTALTSAIRSATSAFGPVTTGITGPTTPLDIDSPAELRREMEQRDRTIETKTAEIAAVNEQLEDATSDTEIARLRRDLAALQADMAAAQTERNAFAARLAEREAAATRAVASTEDEDEKDAPAPSRRVDSRGNLVGGGGGISRGPASEGFVTGGGARNTGAGNTGFSPEFTSRTVDSTFSGAGARGGDRPIVRDAQALPAVSGAGSQLALRVGNASYAVKDVATVVIPRGTQASEQEITRLILAAKAENKIVLDDQQRAMVEVWDEASQSSRMVYVQFNGEAVAFIPLDQSSEQTAPMRATLAQLEGLLGAGRGAASEGN